MRRILRVLAFVLLALAIPVQGVAAVTAGQCIAFGHHHQDGAGEEHYGHTQEGAQGHDHAAHSHDDGGAKQGDEGNHCGPCTACCASASIAGPARLSILCSPTIATYVFSQLPALGVEPDGLDRPPLAL